MEQDRQIENGIGIIRIGLKGQFQAANSLRSAALLVEQIG